MSICTILLGGMTDDVNTVGSQRHKAMKMGCWGQRVGSDVSIYTILLGGMKDDVSTVGSQTTQGHENRLLGPTCWVGCVYMHHIIDRD